MSESVTLLDRGFSLTIAFLLLGLITLLGAAIVVPTVQTWFIGAQTGPTLVGLLFVLLAALALNLVITAVRWFLFEFIHWPFVGSIIPTAPSFDQKNRKDLEVQFIDLRHQFYYHYLAYSNAAVAILLGASRGGSLETRPRFATRRSQSSASSWSSVSFSRSPRVRP